MAILQSKLRDFFTSDALPALAEIFLHRLMRHPSVADKVFKKVRIDRDIWQSTSLHDLPLHSAVNEYQEIVYDELKQGASKTLRPLKYALGVILSKEVIEDGKFDFLGDVIKKLAQSAADTREVNAIQVFNRGFSSELTADGKAVFATDHPLPSGLTFRNKPLTDVDLSYTSLQQALIDFASEFKNDAGVPLNLKPKYLLVPPALKFLALELVGSPDRPDTANRAKSTVFDEGLQVLVSPHLTDADAWFLLAEPEDTGLRKVIRKEVSLKTAEDFDKDALKVKSSFREVVGVTEPYGMWGTSGA